MPISYVDDISDGSGAFIFVKILRRWKGSLYKLVWVDLVLYLAVYYAISLIYRFALPAQQKRVFEEVVRFCEDMKGNIPVPFLLGFFVSGVIGRWYQMYMYIPWMNQISYTTASYVNCGDNKVSQDVRLSLMRYFNLAWILLMRRISDQIADRFKQMDDDANNNDEGGCCRGKQKKKLDHGKQHPWSISQFRGHQQNPLRTPRTPFDGGLEPAGRRSNLYRQTMLSFEAPSLETPADQDPDIFNPFEGDDEWSIRATLNGFNKDRKIRETFGKIITEPEIRAFEVIAQQYFKQTRRRYLPEYWVPLHWATRLVQKAGLHGNIPDPRMIGYMFKEISDFRSQLQTLEVFISIMMPLVYTQVVIIAVYCYFGCEILASQFVEVSKVPGETVVDFFVPVFSIFYFLFLMGWLKVALCVMNPFGDDDEDFETSDILNYNLDLSHRTVLMDESTFPEDLMPATFQLNEMKGAENDNLPQFINSVSAELKNTIESDEINELTNLELKRHCCDCLPIKKRRSEYQPSAQQFVINSNYDYKSHQSANV